MQMQKHMRGVTLLELMIVVVIISIMASIAYPQYRDFVTRAKRNEAKAVLLEIATNQERHYLQNQTYTTDLATLGVTTPTDSGTYAVTIPSADASNFRAVATYIPTDKENTKCNSFTVDGRGNKISEPYDDCWTRTR
jgi:type IV pilus assembly protein PilE